MSTSTLTALRVLVVDDSPVVRDLVRGYLEAIGCAVTELASAEGAALAIASDPPDLIILDVNLGGLLDGTAFFGRLRSLLGSRTPPVVLHSDMDRALLESTAKRLGAEYICKGDTAGLLSVVFRRRSWAHRPAASRTATPARRSPT